MPSVPAVLAPDTRAPRLSLAVRLHVVHADAARRFRAKLHLLSKSGADRFCSDLTEGKHRMRAVENMVALSVACADDADAYAWVDALRAEIATQRASTTLDVPLAELHDAQDRADAEFDMAQRRAAMRPDCPLAQERLEEAARVLTIRTESVVAAERANRERRRPRIGSTPRSSLMHAEDNASATSRATTRAALLRQLGTPTGGNAA